MPFVVCIVVSLLILIFGFFLKLLTVFPEVFADHSPILTESFRVLLENDEIWFVVCVVAAQVWLFFAAIILRALGRWRFDMTVAAEVMIAIGIFSLISGLTISLLNAFFKMEAGIAFDMEALRPIITPFVTGLFGAGVAPLLATILRQVEVLVFADPSAGDGEGLDEELQALGNQVRATTEDLRKLSDKIRKVGEAAANTETNLEALGDAAKASASKHTEAAAGVEIASTKSAAALDAYGKSATAARTKTDELSEGLKSLRDRANDSGALLAEFNKVIEEIRNFIRLSEAGPPR